MKLMTLGCQCSIIIGVYTCNHVNMIEIVTQVANTVCWHSRDVALSTVCTLYKLYIKS